MSTFPAIGKSQDGQYIVVVHTFEQIRVNVCRIRIISARRADRDEIRDYENLPHPWQTKEGQPMKDHYDFRKGERGKFHKSEAVFRLPIYLDKSVEDQLTARADANGMDLSDLVNDLLKKELAKGNE